MNASLDNTLVAEAVLNVRLASWRFAAARFRLDDAGYNCPALDDIAADTAGLLATWAGRRVPQLQPDVPAYFAEAARDWRRRNRRTY